jgi:hypothetical protein
MGGPRSALFRAYRNMCVRAFLEVRKRRDKIIVLVEMMLAGNEGLPCFVRGRDAVMAGLNERFLPRATTRQAVTFVHNIIDRCVGTRAAFGGVAWAGLVCAQGRLCAVCVWAGLVGGWESGTPGRCKACIPLLPAACAPPPLPLIHLHAVAVAATVVVPPLPRALLAHATEVSTTGGHGGMIATSAAGWVCCKFSCLVVFCRIWCALLCLPWGSCPPLYE